MVAVHLDSRISARLDPSDVVQEALTEAFQRLPEYLQERPVAFYPWVRKLAWQRLVKLHRAHLVAARRSVRREDEVDMQLPDDSVQQLAGKLAASGTDPGQKVIKQELQQRASAALDELRAADRELLVMRYLEHMTLQEISETLNVSLSAVRKRHTRALQRLEKLLGDW
jgi:RNA polymerase sigma-70 factor (ECF subfamily)